VDQPLELLVAVVVLEGIPVPMEEMDYHQVDLVVVEHMELLVLLETVILELKLEAMVVLVAIPLLKVAVAVAVPEEITDKLLIPVVQLDLVVTDIKTLFLDHIYLHQRLTGVEVAEEVVTLEQIQLV
tara:strand:+ start:111 stop:491 length:381 start_codon:yes stop_codon:yes gene_type:complete